MRKIPSKIFIDGGVIEETRRAQELMGYLDGQTTNPTLIAKNLAASLGGKKLSKDEALEEYRRIVAGMSEIIPKGSISIQVFANKDTSVEEMVKQARERIKWIPNGSIKVPCTHEGIAAAEIICKEMPINITLNFSQSQAAAVYEATKGAKYPVFISPFVGRLDDKGENGMMVVDNILRMYKAGDHHVQVLTASTRNMDHILYALELGSDIITIPFKLFTEWVNKGFQMPEEDFEYTKPGLTPINFRTDITLGSPWQDYDLHHPLTDAGLQRFWDDWMSVVG